MTTTELKSVPQFADYVIVGAGIHGLSTALHLAQNTQDKKIVVLDKTNPGDGASGIACGVVRNNYYQPAMRRIMKHSVSIWEKYAKELHYNSVGYMQISYEAMHEDVASIYDQQKEIDYESVFIEGEKACTDYMKNMFHDWQAKNITSVLHEKRGGYAHNTLSIEGLVKLVEDAGATIINGTEVTGLISENASSAITKVETSRGSIKADQVIIAPGPWVRTFWNMLGLPGTVKIKGKTGEFHERDMWHYWMLQEGVLGVEPTLQRLNDGGEPPVVHVDTDSPLISDSTGKVLSEKPWGIYYKPDPHFGGVQGGFAPYPLDEKNDQVKIDPYGPKSNNYLVDDFFVDQWCSALAHCQKRFEGLTPKYIREPSGGLGCLTPDGFPVFDSFRENVYVIADSNHGYKMIGIGALVAEELIKQKEHELLKPFRFGRYERGELHPVSNSPYPWS